MRPPDPVRRRETTAGPGYAEVRRRFVAGDVVEVELPVRARWMRADPRVDAVRGQVAVQRGPLVMALESVDLGDDVTVASVRTDEPPVERDGRVLVHARTALPTDLGWPFVPEVPSPASTRDAGLVPLVPYHRWGNRGPSTMRVWMPEA